MIKKQLHLKTKLGHKIAVTIFKPNNPKGIVVITSATGVKQNYYSDFATFLQTNEFIVCTFDYNGIGQSNSKTIKKIKTTASNWGNNDLESVLYYALEKHSDLPLTVIGHSIGGQLIGLSQLSTKIDTIILIASQSGYWKFWKGSEKLKMFFVLYFMLPILTKLFGYFPAKRLSAMENLPKNMALEWKNWCKNSNYLFDFIDKDLLYFDKVNANLISYSTDFDEFAPKIAVDWLAKKYSNTKIERKHLNHESLNIPKIGHFGFFREKFKNSLWQLFLEDLKKV